MFCLKLNGEMGKWEKQGDFLVFQPKNPVFFWKKVKK
jgi:hypothetical protein